MAIRAARPIAARVLSRSGAPTPLHEKNVPCPRCLVVAPLTANAACSTAKYQSLGETYTTNQVFLNLIAGQYPNYPDGKKDNTHFQENGAKYISVLVADGIRADTHSSMKTLATFLK